MNSGVVIRTTGSQYIVRTPQGETHTCRIRGNFRLQGIRSTNPIAIGDVVDFQPITTSEESLITAIHDRKNYIIRRSTNLSKRTHILAANIDQAFLVATIAFPRTSTGFIDRFLIAAEAYHIPASILVNKIDLYEESLTEYHDYITSIYSAAGYPCFAVSALTGQGIEEIREQMKGKITLLSGHSGVGKSEMIRALDPQLQPKTGDISAYHLKGKHTTTFAEMFELSFGGYIIDTPGIKEFGMVDFSKEEVSLFYPEMKERLHACHYANCTHEHEPHCAIKEAVENGDIPEERYQNYLNIINGREMLHEKWEDK